MIKYLFTHNSSDYYVRGHAIHRMKIRHVEREDILRAIQTPDAVLDINKACAYDKEDLRVICRPRHPVIETKFSYRKDYIEVLTVIRREKVERHSVNTKS